MTSRRVPDETTAFDDVDVLPALLDVNVLAALAWPNHVHHDVARSWFQENQPLGWATAPITESGFVRVSSNDRITPHAKSPREAIELLEAMTDLPNHHFWEDDVSIAASPEFPRERLVGYRQISDAHLIALAICRSGRLATLDASLPLLLPESNGARNRVVVITEVVDAE